MKIKLSMLILLFLCTSIGIAQQRQLHKALMDANSITFVATDNNVTYDIKDIQKMTYEGYMLYVYLKDNTIYSANVSSLSISNNGDKTTQNEVVECINSLNVSIFPNPTIGILHIEYTLPANDDIQIDVYNLLGQIEDVLFCEKQSAGEHSTIVNVANISNGSHLLRIQGNKFSIIKTFIKQ